MYSCMHISGQPLRESKQEKQWCNKSAVYSRCRYSFSINWMPCVSVHKHLTSLMMMTHKSISFLDNTHEYIHTDRERERMAVIKYIQNSSKVSQWQCSHQNHETHVTGGRCVRKWMIGVVYHYGQGVLVDSVPLATWQVAVVVVELENSLHLWDENVRVVSRSSLLSSVNINANPQ